MAKNRKKETPTPGELDQLIHERLRLGIICALAVHDSLSFTELRDLLATTDGNLSVQARKLEEAGAVMVAKLTLGALAMGAAGMLLLTQLHADSPTPVVFAAFDAGGSAAPADPRSTLRTSPNSRRPRSPRSRRRRGRR